MTAVDALGRVFCRRRRRGAHLGASPTGDPAGGPGSAAASHGMRPISLLRFSLLDFVDSKFRICLKQTL